MTTWISGVCETNGIDIHYLRAGGAKYPVVLLHGLMGSGACWTRMAAFDVLTPPNPEVRDVVSAIDVPSPLVIGDSSPVVTLEMATELRSLNPRLRIEQVRDAGHGPPFQQPERLGDVVLSFLRELALDSRRDA
jgi:pimeloyl-ACP methyl ester carboxylesterase